MYTSGNTGAIQIFETVPHHPGIDRSVAVRSVTVVSLSRFYWRHLLFQLVARNHSIASFSSHSSVSAPTILVIVCCPFWLPQLLFLFALSTESESSNWFPWFVSVFCFTMLVVRQEAHLNCRRFVPVITRLSVGTSGGWTSRVKTASRD